MADSDKQILITPNVSQTAQPEIKFVGKDNSPLYIKVLDDNSLSFEGTEGQVFSISPTMSSGDIFSVNDISGIQSMAVNSDGTITLNAQTQSTTIKNSASNTATLILENTNADAIDGPILDLYRNDGANSGDGDDIGAIVWSANNDAGEKTNFGRIMMEPNDVSDGSEDGEMIFKLTEGGSVEQEYFRLRGGVRQFEINALTDDIDFVYNSDATSNFFFINANTERIGIGDAGSAPSHLVHIEGIDGGNGELFVERTSGAGILLQAQSATGVIGTSTNHDLDIKTNGSTRMRIESGGDVGIGTTSPAFKLDVNGYIATTDGIVHTGDTNNTITFGTDTQSFNTGSTARMNISDSGLQVGTGARVTTILDEDAMGSDSATALATQQSIKAYVDTNVMSLANDANNRVVTATGSGGLNGEANLTFSGSVLAVTGQLTATNSAIGSYHIVNPATFVTLNGVAINGTNTTSVTSEGATHRFSSSHTLAGSLANGSDVELFRVNVTNAAYRKIQGGKMYIRIQDTATGGFFQETVTFAYTGDGTTPVIYSSTDRLDSQMAGTQSSYDHEKATILVEFVTDYICVKFSNDTGSSIATSGWDARLTCTLFDMEAISL